MNFNNSDPLVSLKWGLIRKGGLKRSFYISRYFSNSCSAYAQCLTNNRTPDFLSETVENFWHFQQIFVCICEEVLWHFISESAGFQTGQKDKRRIHLSITYHMTNIYKHWKNGKHRKKIAHYFFVFVHNSFWNYFFVMIKKHNCTTNSIFSVKWKPEKNLEKKLQQKREKKTH